MGRCAYFITPSAMPHKKPDPPSHCCITLKMRQIQFQLGMHPGPRWGSSWRSPRPELAGEDIPSIPRPINDRIVSILAPSTPLLSSQNVNV